MVDHNPIHHSREEKWSCNECGYRMDAATCVNDNRAIPDEGDITLCLNCGHLYIRHQDKWVEPSIDDYFSLEPELKREIERMRKILKKVVTKDLSKESS